MFPEVGATELMVIAAVALIVVGPKDLPVLLRKVGQFMARMRGMASEFRASFDEMARQSELDELRKEVQALRSGEYLQPVEAAASSHTAQVDDVFKEIEHDLTATPGHWAASHVEPAAEVEPAAVSPPKAKTRAAPKTAALKTAAPKGATVKAAAPKSPAKPRAKTKATPEASS